MTSEQPSPRPSSDQPDPRGDGQAPAAGGSAPDAATGRPDAPVHDADHQEVPAPATPDVREVTVRRAPKFVPFMAVGAILGFLAALVLAYTGPDDPTLTRESVLGFFTVAFALPGMLLAALLVLVIDRRSVRRAERARAERTDDDA
ncbi:hypothetical protein [Arthrobacter pityocampae]|uniref:hypothetical protein n=1 Tax=Arthrobacter pityocampae TaxID=547334 RepID=UPI001F4DACE3|nr:hypothetical protein [Arthrobacter pityocampae]